MIVTVVVIAVMLLCLFINVVWSRN